MSIPLFIAGALIVLIAIIDLMQTVLAPQGAGFVSSFCTSWMWKLWLWLSGRNGKKRFLTAGGVVILYSVLLGWVMFIWLGNTIIIMSDDQALMNSDKTEYITGFSEKLYYSGYVLSSMGNGDYTPIGPWWNFYTSFISFTGVIFISLGISYLLPVVNAVTLKRQTALRIHKLGKNPEEVLTHNFKNGSYDRLYDKISELENEITKLSQHHLAYPVIHYFHSTRPFESIAMQLVMLDEVITILLNAMDQDERERAAAQLYDTRLAITYFLTTLSSAHIDPTHHEPEHPNLDYLEEIDIPNESKNATQHFNDLKKRRKLLLAYLQNDGWSWKDMASNQESIGIENS